MTRHNICARFWNYCFWMNVGGQVEATTIKRAAEKQLRHHTPWVCQKQLPPHVITSSVHLQGNDVMRISVISIQTAVELSNLPLKLISDACVQPKVWAANLCSFFRETRKYFVAVVWLPLYPSSLTHLVPKLKEDLPFRQLRLDSAAPTSPQRFDYFSRFREFPMLSQ